VFSGWSELAGTEADSLIFLNGTVWATRSGAAADTQAPVVTVTAPVGGEAWPVGSAQAITWTATDNVGVAAIDLAYSTDGGASFPNPIATGLANTGTYAWTVPTVLSTTARVRATAHDVAGNAGADSSHADFAITGWAITATPGAHGQILPAGTTVVADGAMPAFSFSPDPGYHVADVELDAVSLGAIPNYTFPPVHANHALTATFALNTADGQPPVVTVTAPTGGEAWGVGTAQAITWSATDNIGVTTVDLAYSTDGGATFPNAIASGLANSGAYNWTLPAVLTSSARVRVRAHDAAGNVGADSSHADFAITGWTVTASAGANGAIAPSGALIVGDGATPAYTITPAAGFHVADVLVDGVSVGAVTNYAFLPVHGNATIAASFAPSDFTVSVTVVGNGTVAKAPDQATYPGGSNVQLTATPDAGWSFAGWSGDASGSANPLTLNVTANRNVTATFSQHVYTWNATGASAWTTATNWTPTRTTPATDDVLLFPGGGAVTATAVPTQTIGKLAVSNNTTVTLAPAAAATLTMAGSAGLGLDVDPGSQIAVGGATALSLVASAATIDGTVALSGGGHRLLSGNAGGIVFRAGSVLTLGAGFSGNVFGTGVAPGALNSVVFENGSLLAQGSGANPFGATQPSTAVVFHPGSRFRLDAALTPSMSGRSYADFELNVASSISPNGSVAWSVDSLLVSQGALAVNLLTAGATIRGSIVVKSGATLSDAPSAANSLTLAGSAANRIHAGGTLVTGPLLTVNMNNAAGIALTSSVTLAGPLNFVGGKIATGDNTLAVGASGAVTNAGQATGWVAGNLKRNVASGSSSRTFDIGDAATYAPVTLAVTGAAAAFDLTASTHTPDHPNLASSDLDPAKSVNRWWTLTPTGAPSFSAFDGTFTFAPGDVDGGAVPSNFLVRRWTGTWAATNFGARTATTTQALGVTGFGDFAIGELFVPTFTIAASAGANGAISPSGSVAVSAGAGQAFSITPDPGYLVADVLVDSVSVGPVTNYTFNDVVANHSISATFSPDVTGVGGGALVFAFARPTPNPAPGATVLAFTLPVATHARIDIVDVTGRRVAVHEGEFAAGTHAWRWDGSGTGGGRVGSGVYFARLVTRLGTRVERIALVR
jgi:hypothetical protein